MPPPPAAARAIGAVAALVVSLFSLTGEGAIAHAAAIAPTSAPSISARAAIVLDARTGEQLYARNAEAHAPIASTTKLMTALLTLERAKQGTILASPGYAGAAAESRLGLVKGERLTVHDLLQALLLPSANDAAITLATALGGGSTQAFVAAMNARARALGLHETHYSNPVGLDAADNYSSAHDLARLASYLLRDPTFAAIVRQPSAHLVSGNRPRTILNRNLLVGRYPFVTGVKTGHTTIAGYVLVGSARIGSADVVSVALGDPSEATRDADSLALLRYGMSQYHVVNAVTTGSTIANATIKYYDPAAVSLLASAPVVVTARVGRAVTTRIDAPREIGGPLPSGARVGRVSVVYDGHTVGSVPLITGEAVKGAGLLRKLGSSGGWLAALACLLLAGAAALVLLRGRAVRGERVR